MSVNYDAATKNARMQTVVDRIASKTPAPATGVALAGQLVIGTAGLAGAVGILATIPLAATPAQVTGIVLNLLGTPLSALASSSGTAARAEIRNNAGTTIIDGLTVGTANADIILTTTTIIAGLPVTVTSGSITHG